MQTCVQGTGRGTRKRHREQAKLAKLHVEPDFDLKEPSDSQRVAAERVEPVSERFKEICAQLERDCAILPKDRLKRIACLRIEHLMKLEDIAKEMGCSLTYIEKGITTIRKTWEEGNCESYQYLINVRKATRATRRPRKGAING